MNSLIILVFASDLMRERFGPCEIQARIDALLAAGMTTSAAKFIHHERGKQTFGKALGRALARLHADLRRFLCTRGQVSTGTAGYELANSASGLSDLHATARRS
ncbi:hypothetical protein QCM80_19245 [Bradyrhizobium sp. SSUT112]|uniref:hypothetical protein n=1 Tax=Bradyrhizobium sp. SSUT112 TaxID=3040604 RepID=UPI002447B791|nr:hypothetical protein [Bradyrhizobium sp. SSUT112]MDH2352775.1 hypothetical protein [Bradyrhizobium sp. SSUT112]